MSYRVQARAVLLTLTLSGGVLAGGFVPERPLPAAEVRRLAGTQRERRRSPRKVMVPKKPTPAHVAEQHSRWLGCLRTLLRKRGRTIRSVERDLGWSSSYLSQVLRGSVVLKVERLLVMLDHLDVSVVEFLGDVYPERGGPVSDAARRLIQESAQAAARAAVAETYALLRSDTERPRDLSAGTSGCPFADGIHFGGGSDERSKRRPDG